MSIISFSFSDIFFDFHFMRAVLENIVKPAVDLYGHIVRVWVLIFPFFAIMDPEDLQIVLSSGKHTEKIFFYKLLHNFLGNGLITSSGNRTWIEKSWCELTFLKFSLLLLKSWKMELAPSPDTTNISCEHTGDISGNVHWCSKCSCSTD